MTLEFFTIADLFLFYIKLKYFLIKFYIILQQFINKIYEMFRIFEKNENEEDSDAVEFHDLNELLSTDDVENTIVEDVILPQHYRCVSHTLNLIAVKDSEKSLHGDISYKKKYRMIFAKLSKLWSKQNQSTQISDKIKEMCGVYLKTPVITR